MRDIKKLVSYSTLARLPRARARTDLLERLERCGHTHCSKLERHHCASAMPRQLPPELLLQLARYGDWTGVVKLQRVSKGMRALLANDANPEQNLIWRHCVQDRWDWVRQDDDVWWSRQEWCATLGSWRRVYAYLRSVGFVARASQESSSSSSVYESVPSCVYESSPSVVPP